MSARTGLGAVEVEVLRAVAAACAGPGQPHCRTTVVLEELERTDGFGPGYALPVLSDMVADWVRHLPLLEGAGNWGSVHGDPPADARYTQVRLTPVGQLAVDAEAERVGPIPLGLIEGTLYRGGTIPPFSPRAVLSALADGDSTVGPPSAPTGTITGDWDALLSGAPARLQLGATISKEQGAIVIHDPPFGIGLDEVFKSLHGRVEQTRRNSQQSGVAFTAGRLGQGRQFVPPKPIPVRDVRNESSGRSGPRIVCVLTQRADAESALNWIRAVWPVTIEVDCLLPSPLVDRIQHWDAGDGSGLLALRHLILR